MASTGAVIELRAYIELVYAYTEYFIEYRRNGNNIIDSSKEPGKLKY